MPWLNALVISVFVAVHIFGGRFQLVHVLPRSRWLSFSGGLSVAYVFIHVLPELDDAQAHLAGRLAWLGWLEHHAYLLALAGLVVFYGIERAVKCSQRDGRARREDAQRDPLLPRTAAAGADPSLGQETTASAGVFWLHTLSFALYNGLIGYLLVHREERDLAGLLLYGVAMALHFVVTDDGLRRSHGRSYQRFGRWILGAAPVAGWALGLATDLGETATQALFALLAGGVVLNVLKEELPEERSSRFAPFALGAAGYALLLIVL